jgi:anti-anti-sigma regulatory factor
MKKPCSGTTMSSAAQAPTEMLKIHSGRVTAANQDGELYLKLTGVVRVTLCLTMSRCIDSLLAARKVDRIVVDLVDARHMDSTTMGLLCRLAINAERRFQLKPVLWCREDYLVNLLAMSFADIYDIETFVPEEADSADNESAGEIACRAIGGDAEERQVAAKVIDAHRALIAVNPDKRHEYTELLAALKAYTPATGKRRRVPGILAKNLH